eukprot:NODE_812_length_690_cov_98.238690_g742_i0.p2 GENE.NODE_812_length_690_cov_98.238690_g742_i0~~NODE_812_length_690_cov_98.238690_g742_i0.p2  ORF type:complete len:55 (-),score=10.94 NODE_812_length_690_cov_98.238690_g742_i0:189-353(-)
MNLTLDVESVTQAHNRKGSNQNRVDSHIQKKKKKYPKALLPTATGMATPATEDD